MKMKNTKLKLIIIVTLIALLLPLALAGTATRSFSPDPATQGQPVTVTLTVTPTAGERFYAIDETVPAGWTITNTGLFTQNGQTLRNVITSVPNTNPVTYTYVVTAPATATSGTFTGGVTFDGSTTPSGPGSSTLTVVPASPCGNGVLDVGEVCDPSATPPFAPSTTCSNYIPASTFTGGALGCTATCTFDTSACTTTSTPPPTPENTPALCQDGVDNDRNGRFDCQDIQCHGTTIGVCFNLPDGAFCYDRGMCASDNCVSGTCAPATSPPATPCTDNQNVVTSGCTCDGNRDVVRNICTPIVQDITNTLNNNSLNVSQIISQVFASLRDFLLAAGII